ncbi:MAG: hypothetical protein AB7G12_17285 [Thermoanaerobaculia bacterium]
MTTRGADRSLPHLESAVAALAIVAALSALAPRVEYLFRLLAADDELARGELAVDRNHAPFIGAVRFRAELAAARRAGPVAVSDSALIWRFFASIPGRVATDARVRLTLPREAPYYFGRYFLYPATVDVGASTALPITDGAALARAAERSPLDHAAFQRLAASGYDAVVYLAPGPKLELLPLDPSRP